MNLVSLVSQFLTPEIIGKIAGFAGLNQASAQKAITAAIPGILAGLVNTASKPGGSQRILEAVTQHPAGDVSALQNAGQGSQDIASDGMKLLSSLMGGSTFDSMKSAIGAFSGAGNAAAGSLLGSLAPVVLGALGKEQRRSGLDASGLSSLLMSQKDNIMSAMPPGFSSLLSDSGLMNTLSRGTETVSRTAHTAEAMAHKAGRSSNNWLYWALPAIALAGLAWYFVADRGVETATAPTSETPIAGRAATTAPAMPELPSIANLTAGNVPIGQNLTQVITDLRATLSDVTDSSSAQAALPRLQRAVDTLGTNQGALAQLPADGKTTLASYMRAVSPSLKGQFDKVLALPGVAAVLKPVADQLIEKFDQFAQA